MLRFVTWIMRKRAVELARARELAQRRERSEHNAAIQRILDQARQR